MEMNLKIKRISVILLTITMVRMERMSKAETEVNKYFTKTIINLQFLLTTSKTKP
jgi:hypothetical protein